MARFAISSKVPRAVLAACVLAFGAGAARAQTVGEPGPVLSAKDAKVALFGIDMQGYVQETDAAAKTTGRGMSWRECIDPKGETLYETPGRTEHGRLRIDDEGQACFAYEGTDYSDWSCFSAARAPKGFRFVGSFGDVFVTTLVRTGVKSCKPRSDLIG